MQNLPSLDLFTAVTVGSVIASNRFAVAPMTNKQSNDDGTLSDTESEWLALRARGGFGLVITGAWAVAPEAQVWAGQTALYDDRHAIPLLGLASRMAVTPALSIVQLIHGGSRHSPALTGLQGVSASAGSTWRSATQTDIDGLLQRHRDAALRVQAAGLTGIEIHSAHGFLPAQFISSTQNRRDDAWGGGLAGRSRFLRQLVCTIRDATEPGFVIGVRLTAEDERHGIHLHETGQLVRWLADDGIDYVHISLGDAAAPSGTDPDRHPLDSIRPNLPTDVPIVAAGGIWTLDDARRAARHGADIVAIGQAAIYNPEWPKHATSPSWSPERPPFTRDRLRQVGVTDVFADYLADGWPGSVVEG